MQLFLNYMLLVVLFELEMRLLMWKVCLLFFDSDLFMFMVVWQKLWLFMVMLMLVKLLFCGCLLIMLISLFGSIRLYSSEFGFLSIFICCRLNSCLVMCELVVVCRLFRYSELEVIWLWMIRLFQLCWLYCCVIMLGMFFSVLVREIVCWLFSMVCVIIDIDCGVCDSGVLDLLIWFWVVLNLVLLMLLVIILMVGNWVDVVLLFVLVVCVRMEEVGIMEKVSRMVRVLGESEGMNWIIMRIIIIYDIVFLCLVINIY